MSELKLINVWTLGERIGGGGFGKVYAASSGHYTRAVAKFVPKGPGADREMLFVNLDGVKNVVPVVDFGETDDSWVLVMPRAEKSLRDHLNSVGGPLTQQESIAILSDIAASLAALDGRVVHRDLKPENVLFYNGRWCLADFGISRYAEATTAPDTQKFSMSPPYAAPEQWRADRASSATDVYALGIIAYELLAGTRPFNGPAPHDYREQHLHVVAPRLSGVSLGLTALVEECLYKAPEARPKPGSVLVRLGRAAQPVASGGLSRLQEVNAVEVARRSEEARAASAVRSLEDRRSELAESAERSLKMIYDAIKSSILDAAPTADWHIPHGGGLRIKIREAELHLAPFKRAASDAWGEWQGPAFDVVAYSTIGIRMPANRYGYEGRGHALWYCDAQRAGEYQWFETAFMMSPLIPKQAAIDPFSCEPGSHAAKAMGSGINEFQVAWPFTPLTVDDLGEFVDRWAEWLASAALGQLQHPSQMPERDPGGSWRNG